MDKNELRDIYKEKRASLTEDERERMSKAALDNLIATEAYNKSDHIFTFINMGTEINTSIAIEQFLNDGKFVYVPITKKGHNEMKFSRLKDLSHLRIGNFDVPEPDEEYLDYVDGNTADMVLVPGLVFDRQGYRVGYGGGFYDRFFDSLTSNPIKIGYCYSIQLTDEDLPINEYDVPVDFVITD